MKYLFIGGSRDGERRMVPGSPDQLVIPVKNEDIIRSIDEDPSPFATLKTEQYTRIKVIRTVAGQQEMKTAYMLTEDLEGM